MLRSRRAHRAGFTLLEILLATLIAALILAALYLSMYVTLQQTQTSRDAGEVETLSRGVFNKMTVDLSGTLGPLPPKSGGNSAASSGTSTTATTSPAGSATTAPATTPATDPTAAAATPGATDTATALSANYAFQGGVVGLEKKIVVYTGRIPETFGRFGNPGEQVRSDQRQIIYWLGPSGGLYRQERPWVTADGVSNSIEPDPESPDAILLAEEVADLSFEYSDGSSWLVEWDGTLPGPDGVTPLGPTGAIRVTLVLRISVGKGDFAEKRMTQVIPVRSAPGTAAPQYLEVPTDGATDATTGSTTTTPSTGTTTPSSGTTTTPSSGTTTTPSSGTTTAPSSGGTTMPSSGGKSGGGK